MENKEPEVFALVRKLFDESLPFNQFIGMKITGLAFDRVSARFESRPDLLGNPVHKILHGGVISSTIDQAGGLMAMMSMIKNSDARTFEDLMDVMKILGTIDLRVDYLRPGRGESFHVTSEILRSGNKIAVTRMELYNDSDYLIAVGTGSYLVG